MARLGASVSGIDGSVKAISVANQAASKILKHQSISGKLSFSCSTAEDFAEKHAEGSFSVKFKSNRFNKKNFFTGTI